MGSEKAIAKFKHIIGGFRWRIAVLSISLYVFFSIFIAMAVSSSTFKRGDSELNNLLSQTLNSFAYNNTAEFEKMVKLAKSFTSEELFSKYVKDGPNEVFAKTDEKNLERLSAYLMIELGGLDEDILLSTDKDGQVYFCVERKSTEDSSTLADNKDIEEHVNDTKKAIVESNNQGKNSYTINPSFLKPVWEREESSTGYIRLTNDGPIFFAVAVPWDKDNSQKGALILGKRIDNRCLVNWTQGMPAGIIMVTSGQDILNSYDKRTATSPTPTMESSLDKLNKSYNWQEAVPKPSKKEGVFIKAKEVELAGKKWKALSAELFTGGKRDNIGFVVFLADMDNLDNEVSQNRAIMAWGVFISAVLQFLAIYFLSPWCLKFAHQHFD
ncbi:hypothetical protein IJT10_01910 [bacterium]|nr:hypothetical protein [bacterium]